MPVAITGLLTLAMALASDSSRALQATGGDGGLSDKQLWVLVESGQSPLAGMSFGQAVIQDPRRVDAMIQQEMMTAMRGLVGWSPGEAEMRKRLYLASSELIRQHNEGRKPLVAMVSLQEETWQSALLGAAQMWPPAMHTIVRANYDDEVGLGLAFERAVAIAERAAALTRNTPDNVEWTSMADVFRAMDQGMRDLLFRGRLPTAERAPMLAEDDAPPMLHGQVRRERELVRIQPHDEPDLIEDEVVYEANVGVLSSLVAAIEDSGDPAATRWFYVSDGEDYSTALRLIEDGYAELVDQGTDPELFVEIRITQRGSAYLDMQ